MTELDELETRRLEAPALSLYLAFGPDSEGPHRFLDPLLRELAADGDDAGEREFVDALSVEIEAAERELRAAPPRGAVAIFSCRPAGLLEVFELPEEVPPMMVFGEQLETWPLREQLERHPGAVVRRPAP